MSDTYKEHVTTRRAMTKLEKKYLTKSRRKLYLALENEDLRWDEDEVLEFDRLWKQGMKEGKWFLELVVELTAVFHRKKSIEVAALALDRAERGKLDIEFETEARKAKRGRPKKEKTAN